MGKFGVIHKWCSVLVQTHEILARGVPLFWSTYTHTHDRLDKLRSALAEAQLKTQALIFYLANRLSCLLEDFSLHLLHDSCNIFMMFVITLPRAGDMMYHPHPESSNTLHRAGTSERCGYTPTSSKMSSEG